ncbi:MAG: HEPN domain-containing protein [Microcystaceae cyanobacterium]
MQEAYQELAERSLLAARRLLEGDLHELAGFCCYHAYESSASALAVRLSKPHGKKVPNHRRKLHIFLECVPKSNRQVRDQVRQLNLLLGSARDNFLYPTEEDEELRQPREHLDHEQIERLIGDVEQVVEWVGHQIRS